MHPAYWLLFLTRAEARMKENQRAWAATLKQDKENDAPWYMPHE